ncbi:unnamed protein product [Parajaminaea phylloscopi]
MKTVPDPSSKQQQKKHLAPAVIPDLPITRRYDGPLPDLQRRPVLLPLLDPLVDAPCAAAPPQHSWERLRTLHHARGRVPFKAPQHPGDPTSVEWTVSTHVCPAAYPRSHINAASPVSATRPGSPSQLPRPVVAPTPEAAKAEEKRQREQVFDDWHSYILRNPPASYFPATTQQEAQARADEIREARQAQLWNVINRYVPPTPSRGSVDSPFARGCSNSSNSRSEAEGHEEVTVVLGHGTGLHKETWEPLLESLLTRLYGSVETSEGRARRAIPRVAEIWSFDAINCGESVQLNEDILGEVVHQHDHARDFYNFVTRYLPTTYLPSAGEPSILERRKDAAAPHPRRILFIAHSVSASMLSILCDSRPDLFAGVALVDPTILKYWPEMARERTGITNGGGSQLAALVRRDVWPTRAEAEASFRKNRAYKHWHPKTLDLWCRFGIRPRDLGDGNGSGGTGQDSVTILSCPKKLEAAAYRMMWLSSYPWTAWERRAHSLRDQVTLPAQPRSLLIRVENTFLQSDALGEELESVARAGGVHEVERWSDGDHLLVQTDPERLGHRLAKWIIDVVNSPLQSTRPETAPLRAGTHQHQRDARL